MTETARTWRGRAAHVGGMLQRLSKTGLLFGLPLVLVAGVVLLLRSPLEAAGATTGAPRAATEVAAAVTGVASVTVYSTVVGTTTTYIGATEAGGFWIQDLADLGINVYRLWTKMDELEWWDDDDARAAVPYACTEIGTPTIATIRADAASGFTHTIPWDWWDERFEDEGWFSWVHSDGAVSRKRILDELTANDIMPLVVLRTWDDANMPDYCGGAWAPQPPVDETFRNEWWEHCFAIAYWLNVRNDYGVTHFQVLNESDLVSQGWTGTSAEYAQLVLDAHDAISTANGLAGLPVYIHAPVVSNYGSAYVAATLDSADNAVQVVDYHTYDADVRPSILGLRSTISSHNPDGVLEPVWNSEWGALWATYDTFARAMLTADQLLTFAEEQVEGVTIFNMYDWGASGDYGLVDLQVSGTVMLHLPTETYYAYRLMARGLVGGKERLALASGGLGTDTRAVATRDSDALYLILLRDDTGVSVTVTLDLAGLGVGDGVASVYEYSTDAKDQLVASPAMADGLLSFVAPADGISLVVVPLSSRVFLPVVLRGF